MPWYSWRLGWCHAGFLKGVRAIFAGTPLGETVLRGEVPLTLTGHSKGGAEATILAAMLCQMGRPPRALVTFGSPRAGFARLGEIIAWAGVAVRRYTIMSDLIPTLPFPGIVFRYRHVGRPTVLLGPMDGLEAHRIREYRAAMVRCLVRVAPRPA